jgi:MPBQ/MSBQ methyltransferase
MALSNTLAKRRTCGVAATEGARIRYAGAAQPSSAPRLIQNKKEAFWFYRFISIAYDELLNPPHYTEDMRDAALEPVNLHSRNLKVVDVGGGTGFTTLGIVQHVDPENITLLDQSPHQLEKARRKEALKGVTIMEGDAEDLPFPADTFDRYVSAGRSLLRIALSLHYFSFSSVSSYLYHSTGTGQARIR